VIVAFTEGPTVDAAGNVFFTETTNNRILKLGTDGKLSVFREKSNAANGLLFDLEGRLLACEGDPAAARVTRTEMQTGKITVLADRYQSKRFRAPNDLTIDSAGRIYFTDQNRGAPDPDRVDTPGVYRIDPDGSVSRILAAPDIEVPNGIQISPDDKTLYLVESNQAAGGARMLRAYDLQPDGTVRNSRVFHQFYPGRSADGLAIDTQGNVYAAAGLNRRRGTSETLDTKCGVYVFSPKGEQLQFIPIPEDTLTNLAFGGPDRRTLYATAGKTLFRIPVTVPGTPR
jgi:gluconolactonase